MKYTGGTRQIEESQTNNDLTDGGDLSNISSNINLEHYYYYSFDQIYQIKDKFSFSRSRNLFLVTQFTTTAVYLL